MERFCEGTSRAPSCERSGEDRKGVAGLESPAAPPVLCIPAAQSLLTWRRSLGGSQRDALGTATACSLRKAG